MTKTVFVSGGTRGIGKSIAIYFSSLGYNVAINYLSSNKEAHAMEKEYGMIALRGDVSDFSEVHTMIDTCYKHFNTIDVLINNAAIAQQKLFCDITSQDFKRMLDVNIVGVFNLTKCVLPQMISRKQGKIINISSIYGICGGSCEVHYSASKGAVIAFTKALAQEVGPSNIQVNCIAPGVIATDMLKDLSKADIAEIISQTPLGRLGTPIDIAKSAAFLASDSADFITGQVLSPNGGIL